MVLTRQGRMDNNVAEAMWLVSNWESFRAMRHRIRAIKQDILAAWPFDAETKLSLSADKGPCR